MDFCCPFPVFGKLDFFSFFQTMMTRSLIGRVKELASIFPHLLSAAAAAFFSMHDYFLGKTGGNLLYVEAIKFHGLPALLPPPLSQMGVTGVNDCCQKRVGKGTKEEGRFFCLGGGIFVISHLFFRFPPRKFVAAAKEGRIVSFLSPFCL